MEEFLSSIKKKYDIFSFLENLEEFVQIMDSDLNIVWSNSAAKKFAEKMGIFRHNSSNLFEWLPFLLSHKNKIIQEYKQVFESQEKVVTVENIIISGRSIYTKTIKLPIDNKYIITIVYDQTDLKDFIQYKETEIDRLFGIFDSLNEIVYVTNPDTYKIIYMNKYFINLLQKNNGLSVDEMKKQKCYKTFQNLDNPCSFCTNNIIKDKPQEPYRWQYYNPILNKYFLITDKLVKLENGDSVRFELAIDISDEKIISKKLEETIEKLKISNQMLEDFANIIFHDLKEPLRTVVNFLSFLQKQQINKEKEEQEWINRAYNGSLRMQQMMDKLFFLSKLRKNANIEKENINTFSLINDVLKDLKIKIEESCSIIEVNQNIIDIYGEYSLISQLFSNIIRNAINSANKEKNPIIKISSKKDKNFVTFIIEDNGIGMTKEQINKFFYEIPEWASHLTPNEGGLGLLICRRVISLHNGNIYAKSDENGTKIYFSLPIRLEDDTL